MDFARFGLCIFLAMAMFAITRMLTTPISYYYWYNNVSNFTWVMFYSIGAMIGYSHFGYHHKTKGIKAGLHVQEDGVVLVEPLHHKSDPAPRSKKSSSADSGG